MTKSFGAINREKRGLTRKPLQYDFIDNYGNAIRDNKIVGKYKNGKLVRRRNK